MHAVAKSIVKFDIIFSHEPPWLKSILKFGILLATDAVAKSIVKFDILFSHRPPWLKSILKFGILFSHKCRG